jgi:uncharacterized protein YbjT (DUF2867 family)
MGSKDKIILVTGATGRQGGAVVRHLLDAGFAVRAATRDTTKPAAKALLSRHVELFETDLNDRESLDDALAGCYGCYSMQTFAEGLDAEVRQGKALADAAKSAGVSHFVYSSVGSASRDTGIPHFETKWQIELHIRRIGLPATIIRPVWFMENLLAEPTRSGILEGTLSMPLPPDRTLQMVAVDDIGGVVAAAFDRPMEYMGQAIDLAGDEMTMRRLAEQLSSALDRPVRYVEMPIEKMRRQNREWAIMFEWFIDVGYNADIAACRRMYPSLKTFETWLSEVHLERAAAERG